jgi:hypothetical protein
MERIFKRDSQNLTLQALGSLKLNKAEINDAVDRLVALTMDEGKSIEEAANEILQIYSDKNFHEPKPVCPVLHSESFIEASVDVTNKAFEIKSFYEAKGINITLKKALDLALLERDYKERT